MKRLRGIPDSLDRESYYSVFAAFFLFTGQMVWWYLLSAGLSTNVGRVFGFPAWFFYSVILGFIFFTVTIWIVFSYISKKHGTPHDSSA